MIAISSPTATSYLHNSTLTLGYTVNDGGSGVATIGPTLDGAGSVGGHGLASGQAINLLTEVPSGSHVFAVHTADAVGNTSDASVSFQVVVTADSIRDEVGLFRTDGDIAKQGIAQLAAREARGSSEQSRRRATVRPRRTSTGPSSTRCRHRPGRRSTTRSRRS